MSSMRPGGGLVMDLVVAQRPELRHDRVTPDLRDQLRHCVHIDFALDEVTSVPCTTAPARRPAARTGADANLCELMALPPIADKNLLMSSTFARVDTFCRRFGLRVPVLLAPMAGVPSPALSVAVAHAGGMGGCGVIAMTSEEITAWCHAFRGANGGPFQLNTWIPDPPPARNAEHESARAPVPRHASDLQCPRMPATPRLRTSRGSAMPCLPRDRR